MSGESWELAGVVTDPTVPLPGQYSSSQGDTVAAGNPASLSALPWKESPWLLPAGLRWG